jgi:SAM-dependent methyltransferase
MTATGARDYRRLNRELWERQSDRYERGAGRVLGGRHAMSWGLWRVPERDLGALGPVRGLAVLELGCGAARWSLALAGKGAHAVGLDQSRAQLRHARRLRARSGRPLALVRASAERVPFRSGRFDLIFCDWGAMTFCDPRRTVPECARLLRSGGRLVFATASPIRPLFDGPRGTPSGTRLRRPYFGLHRLDYSDQVNFQLTYGEWIALFRANGFDVERLIETQPRPRARSVYLTRTEEAIARRYPLEAIWSVRRSARPSPAGSRRTTL